MDANAPKITKQFKINNLKGKNPQKTILQNKTPLKKKKKKKL